MHAPHIGLVVPGLIAASALGQCPVGTPPLQLPVYGYTGSSVGSQHFAADEGIVISDYSWPSGGSTIPFVQVHRPSPTEWRQSESFGFFKRSKALAVRGNIIAWAAPYEQYGSTIYPPEVFVLYHDPSATTGWSTAAEISGPTPNEPRFGNGLSLGGTGAALRMAFSTQRADNSEAVYVYDVDGTAVATLAQTIPDPEPSLDHQFGGRTAIDGDLLAVSAIGDDQYGPNAGAVYIYQRSSGTWTLAQKITSDATTVSTHFGQGVAIRDGRLLISAVHSAGADGDVPSGINFANGFARVYVWNGASFDLEAHFTRPNSPVVDHTAFGNSVDLNGDRAIVGAPQDSISGATSGAAYLFVRTAGVWHPRGALGLDNGAGGWFGTSVALSHDYAFAIAPLHNSGHLAVAVFDQCSLPPAPGSPTRCTPGIAGLVSYVINWFQADPIADFDGNGQINTADIFEFLNAWFAGCP